MSALSYRSYRARLAWWFAGWAAILALAIATLGGPRQERASRPFLERLLGPVAGLAASVQWARADYALRQGRAAVAYARAETALRLDPGEPRGWIFLAHHFIYERGAIDREPDLAARRRWIQAGLDVLARGEAAARDPGALAFERGIACAFQASLPDADRAFPGSAREAWTLAAESFERAASRGRPEAGAAARRARALAAGQTQ